MDVLAQQPWPWFVTGPLIGLSVPLLLLIANYSLGISSTYRHIGTICTPNINLSYVRENDWRGQSWKMVFALGIVIGGFIGSFLLSDTPIPLLPDVYTSVKGVLLLAIGGVFVGFGTRWAAGCTSGHTIFGLATLQWTSLLASVFFFLGGLFMTWLVMPIVL